MAKCKSVEFTIPSADGTPIKINYCFRGRYEKKSLFRAFRTNSQAEQSLV